MPLRIATVLLELIHLVAKVVVSLLDYAQRPSEALILSHAALDLQVLLPELHLELAYRLLAALYLILQC